MHGDDGAHRMALLRTTYPEEEAARRLARELVESGLAACVHVSPVRSTYRWGGALEEATEWLLEARTVAAGVERLWDRLLAGHPYEVPWVEALEGIRVPARYAAWARGAQAP